MTEISERALREIMRINDKVLQSVADHPEWYADVLAKQGIVIPPPLPEAHWLLPVAASVGEGVTG